MKVLIIASKAFYDRIPTIEEKLQSLGHEVTLPNCFDDPSTEDSFRQQGVEAHADFKARMFRQSEIVIERMDAVLVLNFEKNGTPNYIGGATFLEMYDAFRLGKKIFLYHDLPDGILRDEVSGFSPVLISGDLSRVV